MRRVSIIRHPYARRAGWLWFVLALITGTWGGAFAMAIMLLLTRRPRYNRSY